jgi:hypothetical protein
MGLNSITYGAIEDDIAAWVRGQVETTDDREVHNRWTVPIPDLRQTLELAYGTLVNGESGRG